MVNFSITALVAVLALYSLRYCTKRFERLELICLYLFCAHIMQQFFYIYSSAFKQFKVKPEHLEFWMSRMDYTVILPVLLVWVLYICRKTNSLAIRAGVIAGWIAVFALYQKMRILTDVLIDQRGWEPTGALFRGAVVIVLSLAFMYFLRQRVRKDGLV